MLDETETYKMIDTTKLSPEEKFELNRKIPLWVNNLLKPETPEEVEVWIEDPGEFTYLFSDDLLMVVNQPKADPKTYISFYSLEMIESCGLIMNGLDEEGTVEVNRKGELIKNGDIELQFKIGDNIFELHSKQGLQKYVKNLISILNNKLLPNLRVTLAEESAD